MKNVNTLVRFLHEAERIWKQLVMSFWGAESPGFINNFTALDSWLNQTLKRLYWNFYIFIEFRCFF